MCFITKVFSLCRHGHSLLPVFTLILTRFLPYLTTHTYIARTPDQSIKQSQQQKLKGKREKEKREKEKKDKREKDKREKDKRSKKAKEKQDKDKKAGDKLDKESREKDKKVKKVCLEISLCPISTGFNNNHTNLTYIYIQD